MSRKTTEQEILFFKALEELGKNLEKTFDEVKVLIESIFEGIFHKKFDPDAKIVLNLDIENKIVKLINKNVTVIENEEEILPDEEFIYIHLKDAQKIDPNIKVDDVVEKELPFALFERDVVKRVQQMLKQKVREISKSQIFDKYNSLVGTFVQAIPINIKENFVLFALTSDKNVKAFMPKNFINPIAKIKENVPIDVYVHSVVTAPDSNEAQIIVSLSDQKFIYQILESEIPELQDGLIEIVKLVRRAGIRTKVVVRSTSKVIDPITACLGVRGNRITNIIRRMGGEKLDIIKYSDDIIEYIKNAMAPSAVVGVRKQNDGSYLVIVPNRHLSLAIGKGGSNVKLAYEIVETKIDVKPISEVVEQKIDFEFNGNVSKATLARIEAGENVNFKMNNERNDGSRPSNRINFDDIDSTIMGFQEEIANRAISKDELLFRKSTTHGQQPTQFSKPQQAKASYPKDGGKNKPFTKPITSAIEQEDNLEFSGDFSSYQNQDMFSDDELAAMEAQFGLTSIETKENANDFANFDEFDDDVDQSDLNYGDDDFDE